MSGKARSVRASKVIAVSRRGFTAAAFKEARREGIELRTLGGLSPDTINKWFPFEALGLEQKQLRAKHWRFSLSKRDEAAGTADEGSDVPLIDLRLPTTEKVLRLGESGEPFSPDDLFLMCSSRIGELAEPRTPADAVLPPPSDAPFNREISNAPLGVEMQVPGLVFLVGRESWFVKKIEVHVEVTTLFSTFSIGRGERYATPGAEDQPHVARYDLEHVSPTLPKKIHLMIFPAEQRFSLASESTEGTTVELVTGTIGAPTGATHAEATGATSPGAQPKR